MREENFRIYAVEDEERQKKILSIFKKYAKFIIDCAGDAEKVAKFKENPRPKLEDCGFIIPDEVKIELHENLRWAVLKIEPKEEYETVPSFHIKEMKLGVQVTEQWPDGEIYGLIRAVSAVDPDNDGKPSHMHVNIEEFFDKFDVTLKVPFIDANKDLLGGVRFTDDENEIIMSCC
jgi:hypothetical protein